ncbi:MAG: M23 family metallopeptidase [Tetrasphaera sp.]|nr:M23 family metallopeptidase [Tetrasphaera sp.]
MGIGSVVAGAAVVLAATAAAVAVESRPAPRPVRVAGAGAPGVGIGPTRWHWPLPGPRAVVRHFAAPTSTYGSGHRGVDLAGAPGVDVRAVADGIVTHSGVIAGRGTVTLEIGAGLRVTYEPVESRPARGEHLGAGERIGRLQPTGSHCGPTACLHLGVIRESVYLDPLMWFGEGRVVLLPVRGVHARG